MSNDSNKPPAGGFGGGADPYKAPTYDAPRGGPAPGAENIERGGCLTAFLVLMMIANPIIGILYLVSGDIFARALPHAPSWALPALGVLALTNFGFAVGMWMWKKWGVFGSLAVAAAGFVMNLIIGVAPMQAFMGLGGPIILIFLVKDRWARFR